jgi:hypothetical protein
MKMLIHSTIPLLLSCVIMRGPMLAEHAYAQAPEPLNQLYFKGTHNSYASQGGGNSCPVMQHHPVVQMDAFGVWALELDFGIIQQLSVPRLIVGHNSAQDRWSPLSWGFYLEDWLQRIRDESQAFNYRPALIQFEYKDWGDDEYDPPAVHNPLLRQCLIDVFGRDQIFGPSDLGAGPWPTVPEAAGKVIAFKIHDDTTGGGDVLFPDQEFPREHWDFCVEGEAGEIQSAADDGYHVLSADQYQYDWTFVVPAPSNPICVDHEAPDEFEVRNDEDESFSHKECGWVLDADCDVWGNCENCSFDGLCTERCWSVAQHGTYRFPYDTISEGVNHAHAGWTVLIKAGSYPETLTITKTLTLEADGGTVTIGQ